MSRDWKIQRRTIHSPDWDEDESVVIRSYFGDHDRQKVLGASTEYRRDDESGQMIIVATLDKLHATKRKLAVVSWTLKDDEGRPLPFTEDNLLNLPPYVAEFIDQEINRDWDNLGEPPANKDEAEEAERTAREDRRTFHGPGEDPDGGRGAALNGGSDERAREGSTRRRGAETASA
jgi:hypothetical protein